jgi:hypothetical protein
LVLPGSATLLASLAGEPLRTAGPGKRKYQNKSYSDDFGGGETGTTTAKLARCVLRAAVLGILSDYMASCASAGRAGSGLGGDDENRDLLPAMLQLPLELEPGHAPDGNVEE